MRDFGYGRDRPSPDDDDDKRPSDDLPASEVARRLAERMGLPMEGSGRWTPRHVARLAPLVGGVLLLIWLASGIYIVDPGEQGVVRMFGREFDRTSPGLRYRLPAPIQAVDIINLQAVRRAEVGFRTSSGQPVRIPNEALMLTGDENIVDLQLIVQYRVRDPSLYLFRLRDPEDTLAAATEVAIRSVVGNTTIDDVLTIGRGQAQEQALLYLQTLMDDYQSGLLITEVKLQVVDPPDQVKDAFNEVVRAREDRERQQNEAQAYREDIVPKARGEANQITRAAEAYREERVLLAQGDVARFSAVLEEYRKGKDVTRERLYLETIERVLANVRKVVIDSPVGNNVLPYLPITEINRGTQQPGQPQAAPQPAPQPAPSPQPLPQQGGAAKPQGSQPGQQPAPISQPRR
jgi:membrane protease subunit HflK